MILKKDVIISLCPNAGFSLDQNGKIIDWYNKDIKKPTEEEVQTKIVELEAAEPMRLLRLERNQKLAETDWITLKAYSQGVEVSEEWKTYLQSLRDLPETQEPKLDDVGNLTNVSWPEVPE